MSQNRALRESVPRRSQPFSTRQHRASRKNPVTENKQETEYYCYMMAIFSGQELHSTIAVNGKPVRFLMDAGAAVSIVSEDQVSEWMDKLSRATIVLKHITRMRVEYWEY